MTAAITAAIPPAETATPHPMTLSHRMIIVMTVTTGLVMLRMMIPAMIPAAAVILTTGKIPATGRIPPETVIPEAIGMMTGGII